MGTPIKSNKTQENCPPISSNCVLWQGKDVPCLNICTGDSISDVTYMLATELCDLLEEIKVDSFDLTCFNPMCPTPESFHDLIQFIIDKLCEQQAASGTSGGGSSSAGCPDCLITIASCFQYADSLGNTVTQMQLKDYAVAIGNKVCTISTQVSNLQTQVNSLQAQVTYITNNYQPTPPTQLPTFASTCLTDKISSTPVSLYDMVVALEEAFCELRATTGMPAELLSAIFQQCVNLSTSPSMNIPGVNMGSLPGWVATASYDTVADSLNNMWITICDMRAAITSIQSNCCPQGCEGLVLDLTLTFTAPSTLNFFWSGVTTGFQDCSPAGSPVTITDAYGNSYSTNIPVIPNVGGAYPMNLGSTPLNLSTDLTVMVDFCGEKTDGSATCQRIFSKVVVNSISCPTMTLASSTTSVTYSFNNVLTGAVSYTITLKKQSDGSTVDTHVIVAAAPGAISNTFTGLLPGTIYTVSMEITMGALTVNTCPIGVVSTDSLACAPATNTYAETTL